nr:phosphoenolpyruvate-protein phosphotransferase [Salmonella sp. NCTC 7297]
MIPMVHSLDQILWVKSELKKAIAELKVERLRHAQDIPLGIMVEVPSSVTSLIISAMRWISLASVERYDAISVRRRS